MKLTPYEELVEEFSRHFPNLNDSTEEDRKGIIN